MATLLKNDFPQATAIATALNATRTGAIGAAGAFHFDASEVTVTAANATDLATCITLLDNLLRVYEGSVVTTAGTVYADGPTSNAGYWPGHINDTLAHTAADTTNPTALTARPSLLADVVTAANTLKTKINAHLTQSGVHPNDDASNTVSTSNASDLATSITLLNAIKTKLNLHIANALGGASLRVVPV